ncbi:Crp/Fnr family transcriptional regulator [Sorangium sp. So ce1000]|uniref:Crp/Fnr family transcriptional regulator n=1 Tax=Sorangium sp. So ce1000 TaxID=3133325 RepID=UPI003F60F3EA
MARELDDDELRRLAMIRYPTTAGTALFIVADDRGAMGYSSAQLMDDDAILRHLREQTALFKELEDTDLRLILPAAERRLNVHEVLWKRSVPQRHDDHLALIWSGVLCVESDADRRNGKRTGRIYRLARAGELLGITTCLGRGKHAVRVAAHRGSATVLMFEGGRVRRLAKRKPELFERALHHATQLIAHLNLVLDAERLGVRKQLEVMLPMLAARDDRGRRVVDMTREELCDVLGTGSKGEITRALKTLEGHGVLRLERRIAINTLIVLTEPAAL